MIKKLAGSLFILSMVFAVILPIAKADHKSINVEKAISKGDHKALAEYYRSQADAQKKIAEMHDEMKTEYRKTHVHYKGIENTLAGHCGNLKSQALKMANEYETLAKEEEKMIKE